MKQIFINYGLDMTKMTRELLEAAKISKRIDTAMRVCIKPNLVVARPANDGATTHPEIVEGIIMYLKDCGVKDISIAEGAWIGASTKHAWDACGYSGLSKKYDIELIDTKTDRIIKKNSQGIELAVCESVLKADYLINVPVLKGHCQTTMTCCLKNMKGCIPDSEKRRFHMLGLHKPIAALSEVIKPDLHIIDSICGDLSFEEGGNPIESRRIMLGFDPVLLDSYGARLMGHDPDEIGYLKLARQYGAGTYADDETEFVELNPEDRPQTQMLKSNAAKRLAPYIDENMACSACYAALISSLNKTGTPKPGGKIHIGQGFKGMATSGVGVGNCTNRCDNFIGGCPPKAVDIAAFLKEHKLV